MKLFATYVLAALLVVPAVSSFAAEGSAPAAVTKPDLVAGEAKFTAVCVACHAADGNSGAVVKNLAVCIQPMAIFSRSMGRPAVGEEAAGEVISKFR